MNNKSIMAVVAVVLVAVSFYGGTKYAAGKNTASLAAVAGGRFQNQNGVGGARNGTGRGNGIVAGDIISKDDQSVTVKLRDGGSKIVLLSQKTGVMKSVAGSSSDLKAGVSVTVTGTANEDGSVTAQFVQIRPAGFASSTFGAR